MRRTSIHVKNHTYTQFCLLKEQSCYSHETTLIRVREVAASGTRCHMWIVPVKFQVFWRENFWTILFSVRNTLLHLDITSLIVQISNTYFVIHKSIWVHPQWPRVPLELFKSTLCKEEEVASGHTGVGQRKYCQT